MHAVHASLCYDNVVAAQVAWLVFVLKVAKEPLGQCIHALESTHIPMQPPFIVREAAFFVSCDRSTPSHVGRSYRLVDVVHENVDRARPRTAVGLDEQHVPGGEQGRRPPRRVQPLCGWAVDEDHVPRRFGHNAARRRRPMQCTGVVDQCTGFSFDSSAGRCLRAYSGRWRM